MGNKRWSKEEIDYLKENIGHKKVADIAQKLNRTETSVMVKFKRLKLGQTKNLTGRVSCGEIARLLHIDRNTVYGWVQNHGLPATRKVTALKKRYVLVFPEDFWEWAYRNRDKIDFRLLERNAFPPEPEWVEAERANPSYSGKNYQDWSTNEEVVLVDLIAQGFNFDEVAVKLKRSLYSVERKYQRLQNCSANEKNRHTSSRPHIK